MKEINDVISACLKLHKHGTPIEEYVKKGNY